MKCSRCGQDYPEDCFISDKGTPARTCNRCRSSAKGRSRARNPTPARSRGPRECTFCHITKPEDQFINEKTGREYAQCKECRVRRQSWKKPKNKNEDTNLDAQYQITEFKQYELLGKTKKSMRLLRKNWHEMVD